jgi:hypothetical protein
MDIAIASMAGRDNHVDSLFLRLRLWAIEGIRCRSNGRLGRSAGIPDMARLFRLTIPAESIIVEPACRHYFSFLARARERQACVEHRHLFPRFSLERYPKCQVGRTALLVGRTSHPLRIVADLSLLPFMRESAARLPASIRRRSPECCPENRPSVPSGVHSDH